MSHDEKDRQPNMSLQAWREILLACPEEDRDELINRVINRTRAEKK